MHLNASNFLGFPRQPSRVTAITAFGRGKRFLEGIRGRLRAGRFGRCGAARLPPGRLRSSRNSAAPRPRSLLARRPGEVHLQCACTKSALYTVLHWLHVYQSKCVYFCNPHRTWLDMSLFVRALKFKKKL